jgi:hypothetical protein
MEQADFTQLQPAVARFCEAAVAKDIDGVISTLAEDAELVSPLSGKLVFSGRDDLRTLLGAVYGLLRGIRWEDTIGHGQLASGVEVARVMGLRIDNAIVFELGSHGEIVRLRPHLRPWLATTLFAPRLVLELIGHPGIMLRAARAGARRGV